MNGQRLLRGSPVSVVHENVLLEAVVLECARRRSEAPVRVRFLRNLALAGDMWFPESSLRSRIVGLPRMVGLQRCLDHWFFCYVVDILDEDVHISQLTPETINDAWEVVEAQHLQV